MTKRSFIFSIAIGLASLTLSGCVVVDDSSYGYRHGRINSGYYDGRPVRDDTWRPRRPAPVAHRNWDRHRDRPDWRDRRNDNGKGRKPHRPLWIEDEAMAERPERPRRQRP